VSRPSSSCSRVRRQRLGVHQGCHGYATGCTARCATVRWVLLLLVCRGCARSRGATTARRSAWSSWWGCVARGTSRARALAGQPVLPYHRRRPRPGPHCPPPSPRALLLPLPPAQGPAPALGVAALGCTLVGVPLGGRGGGQRCPSLHRWSSPTFDHPVAYQAAPGPLMWNSGSERLTREAPCGLPQVRRGPLT